MLVVHSRQQVQLLYIIKIKSPTLSVGVERRYMALLGMEFEDAISTVALTTSYSDGTYQVARITKNGKWYHLELSVYTTGEHAIQTPIAVIPAGYGPSQTINVPATLRATSSNIMYPDQVQILNNGNILQGATGAFKGCYVDAWYHD